MHIAHCGATIKRRIRKINYSSNSIYIVNENEEPVRETKTEEDDEEGKAIHHCLNIFIKKIPSKTT